MGSGGNKGRGEGREGTYVPSLPTLRPPFNVFFLLKLSSRCSHYLTAWNRLLKMSFKEPGPSCLKAD